MSSNPAGCFQRPYKVSSAAVHESKNLSNTRCSYETCEIHGCFSQFIPSQFIPRSRLIHEKQMYNEINERTSEGLQKVCAFRFTYNYAPSQPTFLLSMYFLFQQIISQTQKSMQVCIVTCVYTYMYISIEHYCWFFKQL